MKNKELFEQAIADAKAVRDTAVANAKLALEETLAPRIMSMIQTKLSEIEEEVEESEEMVKDEAYEKEEEGKMMKTDEVEETDEAYEEFTEADDDDYGLDNMEEGDITEADLEEILAELEAEALEEKRKAKKPSEEKEDEDEDEDEMNEGMGAYEYEKGEEEGEKEAGMEEIKKSSDKISVDELRNIIRDVFMSEMEKTDEAKNEENMEEDFNLEEILAELDEVEAVEEAKKKEDDEEKEKMEEELKEAIKTINILKSELNEVNLLNAKLLYMNKIFKSKNLSEGQKLKVINALDRAANLNEAKNIYETLKDALVETKKSTIKESVGFASKPMGVAPAKTIVNEDVQVTRMKKLAGIIK